MKNFILLFLFLSCAHSPKKNYPEVYFNHSYLFDDVCAQGKPLRGEWITETRERIPHFRRQWEADAPALFKTLSRRFPGKAFKRKELTATVSACPYFISFSSPLTLKLVNHLKSFEEKPRPDHAFSWLVFHELLHTWLQDNYGMDTPLLRKYEKESFGVKIHLHLLAIEQWLYPASGRNDLLAWSQQFYPSAVKGPYPRAWEIINIEGAEAFVKELEK